MLMIPPSLFRTRGGRPLRKRAPPPPPPPPAALTLVAATYQSGSPQWVRLTFDRAVNVSAFDAATVFVDDGEITYTVYRGAGAGTLVTPQTVQVALAYFEDSGGSSVRLT